MEIRHVSGSSIERLRAWLRSDMRTLRWVLLGLYVTLLLALGAFGLVNEVLGIAVLLLITLAAQGLFVFGSGTIDLCRPIKRRRLLLPVAAAAFMFMLLCAGALIAVMELFYVDSEPVMITLFWAVVGFGWIGWGVLLYSYAKGWQRYHVLARLSRWLFAGSLLELLATVPSHLIVIRRPGCLVGLGTMLGIAAGLNVMLFSFGPMILVLFLRPQYRQEKAQGSQFCDTCGYDLRASIDRCPECGTPFAPPRQANSLDPKTR